MFDTNTKMSGKHMERCTFVPPKHFASGRSDESASLAAGGQSQSTAQAKEKDKPAQVLKQSRRLAEMKPKETISPTPL